MLKWDDFVIKMTDLRLLPLKTKQNANHKKAECSSANERKSDFLPQEALTAAPKSGINVNESLIRQHFHIHESLTLAGNAYKTK